MARGAAKADLPHVLNAGGFRHARHVKFHRHAGPKLVLVHEGSCETRVVRVVIGARAKPRGRR